MKTKQLTLTFFGEPTYCSGYMTGRHHYSKCVGYNACCRTCPNSVEKCPILVDGIVNWPCHLYEHWLCPFEIKKEELARRLYREMLEK